MPGSASVWNGGGMTSHHADVTAGPAKRGSRGRAALLVAAVFGTVHAAFSFYWAAGGTWLLATVGQRLVESFAGSMWILAVVGVLKLLAAILPLYFLRAGWPWPLLTRGVCWLGGAGLIVWGGVNMVSAQLVLAGIVPRGAEFDLRGMVGHAWLWDPLFLAWGVALLAALLITRRR